MTRSFFQNTNDAYRIYVIAAVISLTSATSMAAPPRATHSRWGVGANFGAGTIGSNTIANSSAVYIQHLLQQNSDVIIRQAPAPTMQFIGEINARYYFKNYLWGQAGIGFIYTNATTTAQSTTGQSQLGFRSITIELPILVGGYYPVLDHIYAYAGLGPSVFFTSQMPWQTTQVPVTDFVAPRGGGLHVASGIEWLFLRQLGIAVELRYRYVFTGRLEPHLQAQTDPTAIIKPTNPPEAIQRLDLSGITGSIALRYFFR